MTRKVKPKGNPQVGCGKSRKFVKKLSAILMRVNSEVVQILTHYNTQADQHPCATLVSQNPPHQHQHQHTHEHRQPCRFSSRHLLGKKPAQRHTLPSFTPGFSLRGKKNHFFSFYYETFHIIKHRRASFNMRTAKCK